MRPAPPMIMRNRASGFNMDGITVVARTWAVRYDVTILDPWAVWIRAARTNGKRNIGKDVASRIEASAGKLLCWMIYPRAHAPQMSNMTTSPWFAASTHPLYRTPCLLRNYRQRLSVGPTDGNA